MAIQLPKNDKNGAPIGAMQKNIQLHRRMTLWNQLRFRLQMITRASQLTWQVIDAALWHGPESRSTPLKEVDLKWLDETRPLRIAIVAEFYYPSLGGIQDHIYYFARECRRLGHHVTLVLPEIPGDTAEFPHDAFQDVVRIGHSVDIAFNGSMARGTIGKRLDKALRRLLERADFDVVHVHTPYVPTLPLFATKLARRLLVATCHAEVGDMWFLRVMQPSMLPLMKRVNRWFGVSETAMKEISDLFQISYDVLPNGVDIRAFSAGHPIQQWNDGSTNVLFISRHEPRCGLQTLIPGFARAVRRNPKLRLLVAGEGPLTPEFKRLVPEDVKHRVAFLGPIYRERADLYASCQILAFPITIATFGIPILEAWASSTAVIASNIRAFSELIRQDETGRLVDPADPDQWANELCLLAEDASCRNRLIHNGSQAVLPYDWSQLTRRVVRHYREELSRNAFAPKMDKEYRFPPLFKGLIQSFSRRPGPQPETVTEHQTIPNDNDRNRAQPPAVAG